MLKQTVKKYMSFDHQIICKNKSGLFKIIKHKFVDLYKFMINSILLTSNAVNIFYKKVLKTTNTLQKAGDFLASSETG